MPESRRCETLAEEPVLAPAKGFVGFGILAFPHHFCEGAARLDAELIGGNVLRTQGQDLIQGGGPLCFGELREAEDQVEAEIPHTRFPQDADGFRGPGAVVAAAHPAQDSVVHGLHAHADACDAQVQQGPDIIPALGHDVFGVDLYGEFLIGAGIQMAHDAFQFPDVQHGRGPAADVKRPKALRRRDFGPALIDFPAHAVRKKFLRPGGFIRRTDLRIKVAVGAETFAEGNVQVDHPLYRSSTSALPRKLWVV